LPVFGEKGPQLIQARNLARGQFSPDRQPQGIVRRRVNVDVVANRVNGRHHGEHGFAGVELALLGGGRGQASGQYQADDS